MRLAFGVFGHLHQAEHFFDPRIDFIGRQFVLFQTECDVLLNRHMREEGVALEHHVDRTLIGGEGGNILAVQDDAAFTRGFHAGQHAQQG